MEDKGAYKVGEEQEDTGDKNHHGQERLEVVGQHKVQQPMGGQYRKIGHLLWHQMVHPHWHRQGSEKKGHQRAWNRATCHDHRCRR